ncbi:potassium transporter Kup [Lichenicola sp.]|uniref:potassium transporter Kup n=1 Tax=Lichenicola sp. TaxID=2804529 RepID=UPI003B00AD84
MPSNAKPGSSPAALKLPMLAALGIVYGDLGTSPLYTMQTVLETTGGTLTADAITGLLSLIVWALIIVVALKYCVFVMRADNHGEGGILALTALVTGSKTEDEQKENPGDAPTPPPTPRPARSTRVLLTCGLFGGALLYGDGILTPSISVLSAIEGVKVATPALSHFVLPVAMVILLGLFALQPFGTEKIGRLFGPIMLLWFIVIGGLGAYSLASHPEVLWAIDPRHGIGFLAQHHWQSFAVLGGVFLALTGAEALYADMGHLGRTPIRLSWFTVVLPALLLCYAGQSASLIGLQKLPANPFYGIIPRPIFHWAIWPMVLLATCATVIASQAIITGVFSLTRQAIQLGWFPGLNIRQTSDREYGQIYVPVVNWTMMLLTLVVTASFGSSSKLAGAYGMAVSTTMLLTTALLYSYLRRIGGWSMAAALPVAGFFLVVDLAFFGANLLKIVQGGFVPLLLGGIVFVVMTTWRRGIASLQTLARRKTLAPELFLRQLAEGKVPRVPGVAVFLARLRDPIPPGMVAHVAQFGALQENVVTLTIEFADVPRVDPSRRITLHRHDGNVWHAIARYGFVEIPSLPAALAQAHEAGCPIMPENAIFIGVRDEVVRDRTGGAKEAHLSGWRRALFSVMYRNAVHLADRFALPPDRYVQIGRQVGL